MQTLSAKQLERKERKKQKLAALANLIKSNDKDRKEQIDEETMTRVDKEITAGQTNGTEEGDADGFTKVSRILIKMPYELANCSPPR